LNFTLVRKVPSLIGVEKSIVDRVDIEDKSESRRNKWNMEIRFIIS